MSRQCRSSTIMSLLVSVDVVEDCFLFLHFLNPGTWSRHGTWMEHAEASKLRANVLYPCSAKPFTWALWVQPSQRIPEKPVSNENRPALHPHHSICKGPLRKGKRSKGSRRSAEVDHDARALMMIAAGLKRCCNHRLCDASQLRVRALI